MLINFILRESVLILKFVKLFHFITSHTMIYDDWLFNFSFMRVIAIIMNHHISRRTLRTTIRLPILFKLINCHLIQEINFEEFTRANGRYYHPEHFQCWQCAVVLSGEKYYGCGVYPMCLTCYDVQLAKPCRCCKGAIQVCVILSFFFNSSHLQGSVSCQNQFYCTTYS